VQFAFLLKDFCNRLYIGDIPYAT